MKKTIKGKQYIYLYKSNWVNGRPVSKFVRYLGPADKLGEAEIEQALLQERL